VATSQNWEKKTPLPPPILKTFFYIQNIEFQNKNTCIHLSKLNLLLYQPSAFCADGPSVN